MIIRMIFLENDQFFFDSLILLQGEKQRDIHSFIHHSSIIELSNSLTNNNKWSRENSSTNP